jgi:hypothetical protein
MPTRINATHTSRGHVAGSPNSTMPSATAPTAPIPVQIAYAVPIGSVFTAIASSTMLTAIAASVPALGQSRLKPSVYLRPMAHTISNSPASSR